MAAIELTLEQKRAVALARARRRRTEQETATEVPTDPRDTAPPSDDPLASYKQLDRNLVGGAVNAFGKIGSTILWPYDAIVGNDNRERRQSIEDFTVNVLGAQPDSGAYTLGELGVDLAGTAGVGGVLGKTARAVPGVGRFATALESGGFRTTPGISAPAKVAERAVGGATLGGTSSLLIDPEYTGYGAALGTALPFIAPPVINNLATGAGYFNDLMRGRLGAVNAGEIVRNAAGGTKSAIEAALGAAPDALPSQTTAEIGTPAWQALLRIAETQDPAGTAAAVRTLQGQEQLDALRRIAGGANQTEARAGREASKRALDTITTPMRETELAAAGEANRVLPGLEAQASKFRGAAAAKVEDVRRMSAPGGVIDRATEWATRWKPSFMRGGNPVPRYPMQYTYPGELAARAEGVSSQSAEASLIFGAAARDAEARAASLEAEGLRRLTSKPITDALRAKLANPEIGVNTQTNRAITRLIDMLDDWTAQNGAITPEAIYAIRKEGISAVVDDMLPNATPKARRAFTAKVLTNVKPLLDDAIEQAGGTGWRDYLRTFEDGMHAIDQRKLAARAMTLYRKSPKKFIELVEGNDPEAIEKIFGPGSYDLVQEMGQGKANVLRRVAGELVREQTITGKVKEGLPAAQTIIERNQKSLQVRIPNWFDPKVTISNKLLEGLEGKIGQKTMDALVRASRSGASMNELLNTMPTAERNKLLLLMRNTKGWGNLLTSAATSLTDAATN